MASCPGAKIYNMSCPLHRLIIVFDDEEGIALCSQGFERVEELLVVTGVEPNRRLIQNIEDTPEVGAQLVCQTNTLSLAA